MSNFENLYDEEYNKEAMRLMNLKSAGRILELPCEPGSEVYELTEDNGNIEIIERTMGLLNIVENLPNFGDTMFTNYDDAISARNIMESENANSNIH